MRLTTASAYLTFSLLGVAVILSAPHTEEANAKTPDDAAKEAKIFTVSVYKQVDGQWIKQKDHTFNTKDVEKAREYVSKVESYRGWKATSAEVVDLEGRSASGKLGKINGGTRFFAEFRSKGVIILRTKEEQRSFEGTWTQDGDKVTMKAGASRFAGTIKRRRIDGTRRRTNAKRLRATDDTWFLEVAPIVEPM